MLVDRHVVLLELLLLGEHLSPLVEVDGAVEGLAVLPIGVSHDPDSTSSPENAEKAPQRRSAAALTGAAAPAGRRRRATAAQARRKTLPKSAE